jgi:hypothetical protein
MMSLLNNLFGRRHRRFGGFGRRSHHLDRRSGGMALGSIAALAAPFVIRKLRQRRAHHAAY